METKQQSECGVLMTNTADSVPSISSFHVLIDKVSHI